MHPVPHPADTTPRTDPTGARTGTAHYSQNSERAALLLLALAECGPTGLQLRDLAAIVGAEKPAVHRALLALRRHGMVAQTAQRGRYRLGRAALGLGRRRISPTERIRQWKPSLAELGREFGASVFLLERSGLDAIITDMFITDSALPILGNDGLGGRLPLGYGPGSTVILAAQEEGNRAAIVLANAPRYQALGVDVDWLTGYLSQVRDIGYDYRRNAVLYGMSGMAVPLYEWDGSCCAALTVAKTSDALSDEEAPRIIAAMRAHVLEHE